VPTSNVTGTDGRLFAEQQVTPDEHSFMVNNTSDEYYNSPYYKQHQDQLQPVPSPRVDPPRLDLADIIGADAVAAYTTAKKLSFHAVGDTGASSASRIANEASVADSMVADLEAGGGQAFLYHLGDIIYNFGEVEYYYDQFYEPFRLYDRPIFAIPGNHDGGAKYGADPTTPLYPSLLGFQRNFCAATAGPSPDSGGLIRSTMTQPGVYFTLDAPFVSIIGLYTNVLEGPGVISAQGTAYPTLDDTQVNFLTAELQRLATARRNLERAVILTCHHPPASADVKSGGATGLSGDIDRACAAAGFYPDAVLSGHAHIYQRFTRASGGRTIPYIVGGSGGHNVTIPPGEVLGEAPLTWGDYSLVKGPLNAYGYLTVALDHSDAADPKLTITFVTPGTGAIADTVTVELKSGTIVG
jgi:Calcineurin-like phosphoesterase